MSPSRTVPHGVVELLRLLTVVFFAGLGYEVARDVARTGSVLGPFNGIAVGVIVGSGLGYVLGGMLGRTTVVAADRARTSLHDVSAETLVAGGFGLIAGVLVGVGVAWPLFLIRQSFLAVPLFAFVVAVLGYVGFTLGASRREGMIALFGHRAGMASPNAATSAVPRIVDSSAAIDGRVLDVVRAGFLHGAMLVPAPVLAELQGLADAGDDLRRGKGRRGLATLEALRREPGVTVDVIDDDVPAVPEVDAKLVRLCLDRDVALLTLDTNLARAAMLAGVRVLNLHALALALRPPVAAGDDVAVLLLKPGREAGQAVGYLDDGSMVVVERARALIGNEATVHVTSVLTTANGRMVFGRPTDKPVAPAPSSVIPPRRPSTT